MLETCASRGGRERETDFKRTLRFIVQSGATEKSIVQFRHAGGGVFDTGLHCVMVYKNAVLMFSDFIKVIMPWKHFFWMYFKVGDLLLLSAGDGQHFVGKRWSAHLPVSKHTAIRLLKCRARKMWRPFLFIYQALLRLPVHRINIEGWGESSWLNQLPGRWKMWSHKD